MRNVLLAFAMLLGTTSCSNDPERSCTLLTCTSGVSLKTTTTLTHDQLLTAVITVCRNDGCSSGKPTDIPTGPTDLQGVAMEGPVATTVQLAEPSKGTYSVSVSFAIDDQTAKDGDYYEIRIDKDAAAKLSGNVKYTEITPNGADCPPDCRTATLQK